MEAEAFSGRVVVVCNDGFDPLCLQCGKVRFFVECASEASDGVFDAPFDHCALGSQK